MEEQHFEYRTGRTDPEKTRRGLITVLLVCVIFLAGLVSVLSFMNIHLTRLLVKSGPETAPLAFAAGVPTAATGTTDPTLEGMCLQLPDPVYQYIHELPHGLYISYVAPGSPADRLGILPGDVLLSCNGTLLNSLESFYNVLSSLRPGQEISLLLCRNEQEISLSMTLSI